MLPANTRIIVIDHDAVYGKYLALYLSAHGYVVDSCTTGNSALEAHSTHAYNIFIMPLIMANEDALEIVRTLYSTESKPGILMLSSYADELERIVALEIGADNVITKSSTYREILARVRAIIRRHYDSAYYLLLEQQPTKTGIDVINQYTSNGWVLNLLSLSVLSPSGDEVTLTRSELQILIKLFRNPGFTYSRDDLAKALGKPGVVGNSRVIDSLVAKLRRKLNGKNREELVMTSPGRGYYCK